MYSQEASRAFSATLRALSRIMPVTTTKRPTAKTPMRAIFCLEWICNWYSILMGRMYMIVS